eukprot:jgi/Tetstr1/462040/TSEL_007111.t1
MTYDRAAQKALKISYDANATWQTIATDRIAWHQALKHDTDFTGMPKPKKSRRNSESSDTFGAVGRHSRRRRAAAAASAEADSANHLQLGLAHRGLGRLGAAAGCSPAGAERAVTPRHRANSGPCSSSSLASSLLTRRHWTEKAGAEKLAKALSSTMCFVGAFARADSLPGYQDAPEPEGMSEEQSWEWAKQRRKRGRQKRLVGYARASGDSTLVSTLYDVAVHPDLHGLGLGKRLIRRVCQSVFGLSIGDVAVMAPEHLEGFFEECSFGPDQVCESYLMAYPMDPGTEQLDPASHLRRDSLTTLMQRRLRSC